jgi:hypothetical protein
MERESSFIKMEVTMRESGKIIKCMDKASYTTTSPNLLTKASGIWTSSMVTEKYTTIIPSCLKRHLTIKISIN